MWCDQVQTQRFERKYLITETQAQLARELVRCYLTQDVHAKTGHDGYSYCVHSLYLDSPDLLAYWAWMCCEKKRFKLRIRYYDESPDSPLFFEIKRRVDDCIFKQRALVRRSAVPSLLGGQLPGPEHLVDNGPDALAALQRFCELVHRLDARPVLHIGYLREAWVSSRGNSVRVTFDRRVCAGLKRAPDFSTQMPQTVSPFGTHVILELKFTDRFPDWLRDMVQRLNLIASGVAKYCTSVSALFGEQATAYAPVGLKQKLALLNISWQDTTSSLPHK